MKKQLFALMIACASLLSMSAHADKKIRIATEGAWAPFNFIDAQGKPQGFDVDIAHALCKAMKAECTVVTQDWDGLIPALKVRKFDAVVASMSITEERKKQVDFTNHYYSGGLRFLGKKGQNIDISKTGLKGKKVGVQRATISSSHMEKHHPEAKTKLYDNQDSVYLDLIAGRLDVVLADELPAHNWLSSDAGSAFEFQGEAFAKDDKIGIAVRKNDPLKERLNKALEVILSDGTYEKINAKYFPFSIY